MNPVLAEKIFRKRRIFSKHAFGNLAAAAVLTVAQFGMAARIAAQSPDLRRNEPNYLIGSAMPQIVTHDKLLSELETLTNEHLDAKGKLMAKFCIGHPKSGSSFRGYLVRGKDQDTFRLVCIASYDGHPDRTSHVDVGKKAYDRLSELFAAYGKLALAGQVQETLATIDDTYDFFNFDGRWIGIGKGYPNSWSFKFDKALETLFLRCAEEGGAILESYNELDNAMDLVRVLKTENPYTLQLNRDFYVFNATDDPNKSPLVGSAGLASGYFFFKMSPKRTDGKK